MKQMIVLITLAACTLACGALSSVRDTVSAVDSAVQLLQEIDKSGTWTYITQGLDDLAEQNKGYTAVLRIQEGQGSDLNTFDGPLSQDVLVTIQVDSENDALLHVKIGDQVQDYFVDGKAGSKEHAPVYRVEQGRYYCLTGSDPDSALVEDGLSSLFGQYAVRATGVQLLSVAKKTDEDQTIAGRAADHYELESKIPDALNILKKFDNKDLQAKIDQAGPFEIAGDLSIDQKTGALLQFGSLYYNPDTRQRMDFSFEVTQWGGVPGIPQPAEADIAAACSN